MDFAYFINRWDLSCEISGMLQSLSTGCLKGSAILVCKRRNPSFLCPGHPVKSHRPHMVNNDILLRLIQPEVLFCIAVCLFWVCQPMKMVPRPGRMSMPVIQEQIVEHPRSRRRTCIQMKHAAQPVIIISHIQAMPVAAGFSVVRIFLHVLYYGMFRNILDLLKEFSSPLPAKSSNLPYSLCPGNL